ncbi:MAG: ribbon-helix-helix protein, CopG family [Bacteroides sp.]|nr:ribbon-helix-helix protein, CopG family [Bacteroides sp.]MCM1085264.1 ribbon-helix-helix protein, CopG family [Bacteroides sp.]
MAQDIIRVQTSFRLDSSLLEKIRLLAKRENRSLNNFVESLLYKEAARIPNKTTLAAMKEAETSSSLEVLDLDKFDEFVKGL